MKAVLESEPDPLIAPIKKIQAAVADSDGVKTVRRLAELTFDEDTARASRKSWAERTIIAIVETLRGVVPDTDQWDDVQSHAPLTREIPVRNQRWPLWHLIPAFFVLAFWLALFGLSLFAEISNGLFLVEGSGIGFHDNPVGAFCFACVYVIAPLVVFKFARRRLNGAGQTAFRGRLKWTGVPGAIAGVVLFGTKMGLMHEAVDVFSGQQGWQPPLWSLISTSQRHPGEAFAAEHLGPVFEGQVGRHEQALAFVRGADG